MKDRRIIPVITPVINFLRQWPVHLILLPGFFIISNYVQLAGLLYKKEAFIAFLKVTCCLLAFFAILLLVYRNKEKAGFVAGIVGTLFLFFGNIKDMLAGIPVIRYISSYTVLVFVLPVAGIFFLYRILKVKSLAAATLFLNSLFLIYLCIEILKWQGITNSQKKNNQNFLQLVASAGSKDNLWDIYYIVFDCYPSSQYQLEVLGASPNFLDSSLLAKGFYVVKNPKSNYNLTSFSVASTLQMQYLDWMKNIAYANPRHYSKASSIVEQSIVPDILSKNGYRFYNLSIFDLPGHPSVNKERFFSATSEDIIYHNTLWNRLKWQVIPALWPSYTGELVSLQKRNTKRLRGKFKEYNQQMLDSLQRLPFSQRDVSPKFIYAHFEMPHYPYFYDSTGKAYPDNEIFSAAMPTDKKRFSNYIAYTNHAALSLVNIILSQNNNSIIILQSDHGTKNLDETRPKDAFANYSAFYFPDRNYQSLYDTMSNVNTFRIIFNKYFNQRLPLLQDSSITIND